MGRRLRLASDEPHFHEADGSFRVLAGAYFENRVGAHLSVDRFWAGTIKLTERQAKLNELAAILVKEAWGETKGWAAARVDEYVRSIGLRGCVATPVSGINEHHADLQKADFMLIRPTDTGRDRREKAQLQAQQLADHFNSLLEKGKAEFIPMPTV